MKYTKTTNTKLNVRLLKELGIYNAFKIERRKYISDIGQLPEDYEIMFDYCAFSNILSTAFTWNYTKNPLLWERLYNAIPIEYKFITTAEILKNEALMNTLKNVVECYKSLK